MILQHIRIISHFNAVQQLTYRAETTQQNEMLSCHNLDNISTNKKREWKKQCVERERPTERHLR